MKPPTTAMIRVVCGEVMFSKLRFIFVHSSAVEIKPNPKPIQNAHSLRHFCPRKIRSKPIKKVKTAIMLVPRGVKGASTLIQLVDGMELGVVSSMLMCHETACE